MNKPSCDRCLFFVAKEQASGECRKLPPTMFVIPGAIDPAPALVGSQPKVTPPQLTSAFPGVHKDSWCGEWQESQEP